MKINAYLGIDIGSISTNLVLLDENKNVIAKRYLPTAGRPIEAVKHGLDEIQGEIGDKITIIGAGTTGSGRHMIGDLIGADIVRNEISAQAAAAIEIDPRVDTVFEIGGQDSKYIRIENGAVTDFAMNKVCAAGTGSFLEEQAEKLGIDIKQDFSSLAARTTAPAPLGDRCTVFIESELNRQLQKGACKADLAAGLAVSIVKNYLNKVVENRPIGDRIFFQGGVAFNAAVVRAFEAVTAKKMIVPNDHEVTGAIGIALIARRERDWEKSRFKGFAISRLEHETKSFECKSCANLCEVNMVMLENDAPVFYGGRCDKWEKKRGASEGQGMPDLFKERDEIVFAQAPVKGGRKIGIPRALFFFERFPFWNKFFSELGFEVVLSSASNPRIIHDALENVATEACFPVTLAHGHILDLIKKEVDYVFLPSLINMEKTSDHFKESFNCPFVQALPYFAKAGISFGRRVKVLSPALEPARGNLHFKKQLAKLGQSLGKTRQETLAAAESAAQEYQRTKARIKKRGEEVLRWIEQERVPALAVISRPYNGSDPVLNLDIPRKLKELGVVAVPIDFLPAKRSEIADEFPHMYWNYGQKILSAARFIDRHPALSAIHITNFRCGPDSFISHLLKQRLSSKPYLEIEVDEHSSDTGVVTRLEAFWDSLANHGKQEVESREQKAESRQPSTGKDRTLYIPRMSAHTLPLAAAIRAYGMDAEVLPPSDSKTLEIGRKYSSGKECHPFVVTTGDFLKKIMEPGFEPSRSAFLMPSASGPCRFGNYHKVHRLLFDRLGYGNVPIFSPDARNSYNEPLGLSPALRRHAWRGIVAADLLAKLSMEKRPLEKNRGETDDLYDLYLRRICQALGSRNGKIFGLMHEMRDAFAGIAVNPNGHKPVIGIVGEIFLRANPECNADIVRRIEALGGRARLAPHSEWIYYTNLGYVYESARRGMFHHTLIGLIADFIQKRDEHRLARPLKGAFRDLEEPSTLQMLKYAAPYLHHSFKGEAVLTIGKAIDFIKNGAAGIINIMPFTCMPGTVVAALAKKVKEDFGDIPWLDLPIDGNEGVNLETRLEAFLHQARDRLF